MRSLIAAVASLLIVPPLAHAGGYASALAVSGGQCDAQALGVGSNCYAGQQQVFQQQVQQVQYVQPVQQVRVVQRVVQVPQYVVQQQYVQPVQLQQVQAYAVAQPVQQLNGYGTQAVAIGGQLPRRGLLGLGIGGGRQVTRSRSVARSRTVTRGR